jgi:2-polyprenyl-6-methoxyphenol hydroxylase-like FAD-dependent oxidoreductase
VRIACVGGGPAGLYFAISLKLRAPEHDIVVYERKAADAAEGWGVTFAPDFLNRLRHNDPASARAIERNTLSWSRQYVCIRGERVPYDNGMEIYNLYRPRLVGILAARAAELGIRVEYGTEVSAVPEADLVVAADGVSSRIRDSGDFGTSMRLTHDKYIWLGTDKTFDAFAYHFAQTDSGWLWASTYGVASELGTFVVHCAPETWSGLGFDTMAASDCLTALEGIFKEELDGHRLMGRVGDATDIRWLSFRNVTNRRWHDGNVVLLGDSAHTTHFTAGLGTTLAMESAIVLADSVHRHGDLEQALPAYQRQRVAEMRGPDKEAVRSGQWFANVSRYIHLEPTRFATFVHARRSWLLPLFPPRTYYALHQLRRRVSRVDFGVPPPE